MYYKEALTIAYNAHKGQVRRNSSIPYIVHPIRVASWFDDDTKKTIAVLHDIIEDTEKELEDLECLFPFQITSAIDALSRRKNETHFNYIKRLKKNELAVEIKIVDIIDNLSDTASVQPDSMIKRYNKSLRILLT